MTKPKPLPPELYPHVETSTDWLRPLSVSGVRTAQARARAGEGPIHAAADALVPRFRVALRYAWARGKAAVDWASLVGPQTVLSAQDATSGVGPTVRSALGDVLPSVILASLGAGGHAGLARLLHGRRLTGAEDDGTRALADRRAPVPPPPAKRAIGMQFNQESPDAIDWAQKHAGELIDDISTTSEKRIHDAVVESVEGQLSYKELVNQIDAAIGNEDRAQTIARHETMLAASEGQRQAWDQAVKNGLLTGDEKREWITVGDDNVCPICDDLDGEVVGIDEEYPNDGGDGPPQHVNCRCTEGIVE